MKFHFLLSTFQLCLLQAVIFGQSTEPEVVWPQCEEFQNCTDSFPYCPDCSLVDCFPKFNRQDCPKETVYEENLIWGCCPACVKYLQNGTLPFDRKRTVTKNNLIFLYWIFFSWISPGNKTLINLLTQIGREESILSVEKQFYLFQSFCSTFKLDFKEYKNQFDWLEENYFYSLSANTQK